MTTTARNARVAGLLYLLLILLGPVRLIYIPNRLFVHGDATATAANIAAHELLFRLGMAADVVGGTVLVFFAMALYRLFKDVHQQRAILVLILGGVMPAASFFFNVVNDAATLSLIRGEAFLSVFDKPQRDALAMLFLRLHDQEVVAAEMLWGVWLFPLAMLVWRSRFFPRVLAVWLVLGGISYVVLSLTGLVLPQYQDLVFRIGSPMRLGELAFTLWLLVMGAKEPAK